MESGPFEELVLEGSPREDQILSTLIMMPLATRWICSRDNEVRLACAIAECVWILWDGWGGDAARRKCAEWAYWQIEVVDGFGLWGLRGNRKPVCGPQLCMTTLEAADMLERAKHVLDRMGLSYAAGEAERYELYLRGPGATEWAAHQWARMLIPPGKRGHVTLVLEKPANARALAFIVGVLKAVR